MFSVIKDIICKFHSSVSFVRRQPPSFDQFEQTEEHCKSSKLIYCRTVRDKIKNLNMIA